MSDWRTVARIAESLPGVVASREHGELRQWRVRGRLVAWERPLRPGDVAAFGEAPRDAPVLAVRVADLGAKQALLAQGDPALFTIPHFDGYLAVLAWLDLLEAEALRELVVEAWLERAPRRLVTAYLQEHPGLA